MHHINPTWARSLAVVSLIGIVAPISNAQVQCGDGVVCGPNEIGPFSIGGSGIYQDLNRGIQVPVDPTDYSLSVSQFDPVAIAANHPGFGPEDVHLKQVEVSLNMMVAAYLSTAQNLHLTDPCDYWLEYTVEGQILSNPSVGTDPLVISIDLGIPKLFPAMLEAYDGIPGGADYDERDLSFYDPSEYTKEECLARIGDLSAWEGAGSIDWTMVLFGSRVSHGCSQVTDGVTSTIDAGVRVTYIYCLEETVEPPTFECAGEGCTPGYWKNHTERWDGVGGDDFTETIFHHLLFNGVLGVTEAQSGKADTVTLLEAASTGGGGLDALGRHTVAALASSDTPIHYAYGLAGVIALYRDAVDADPGPETVNSVHQLFGDANEAGCPLSNNYEGSGVCLFCFGDEMDCPCGADFIGGGCANSTGQGGLLTDSGSTSSVADDLVLTASNLPALTPVIWIQALATARQPLNDGLLCLSAGGSKIFRILTQESSAAGVAVLGPGIVQMSLDSPLQPDDIFPGSTWYFQAYYRDAGSPCGGNANLTNAAAATFY